MQKIAIQIAYEGTHYFGWQKQITTDKTIQGIIENAVSRIFGEPTSVQGSGRTDAGVHAMAQMAHFKVSQIPESLNLVKAINSNLPKDIAVTDAWLVPEDFHAKSSVVNKTYLYKISNKQAPLGLYQQYSTWIPRPLSIDNLNEITKPLIGKHDFASFQNSGTDVAHTIREIFSAQWGLDKDGYITFKIKGGGFLKQMVRNIVGTTVDLALEGQNSSQMELVLASKDRRKAGKTAPPQGLYLKEVIYPDFLDRIGQKLL